MRQTYVFLLPLIMPGLITFFFLHFVNLSRASFTLTSLNDQNMTLPLALAKLKDSSHRIPESVGMVVATFSLIPVLGLFVLVFSKMKPH